MDTSVDDLSLPPKPFLHPGNPKPYNLLIKSYTLNPNPHRGSQEVLLAIIPWCPILQVSPLHILSHVCVCVQIFLFLQTFPLRYEPSGVAPKLFPNPEHSTPIIKHLTGSHVGVHQCRDKHRAVARDSLVAIAAVGVLGCPKAKAPSSIWARVCKRNSRVYDGLRMGFV